METTLPAIILILISVSVYGQNENPYRVFGYEAPVMSDKHQEAEKLLLINQDSTSSVWMLAVDPSARTITIFDRNKIALQYDTLTNYAMMRWLSPDPYGQFSSPYLGMGNAPHMRYDPDGGWSPYLTGTLIGAAVGTGLGAIFDDNFKNNWWMWTAGGAAAGALSVWGYAKITNSTWEKGYATIVNGKKTWHNQGWRHTGYTKAIPAREIALAKTIPLGASPTAVSGELATYTSVVGSFYNKASAIHRTKSVRLDATMGPENTSHLTGDMQVSVQSGNETVLSELFLNPQIPGMGNMAGTSTIPNTGQQFKTDISYQHPWFSGAYFQPQVTLKVTRKVRVKRNHFKPKNGLNGWYEE